MENEKFFYRFRSMEALLEDYQELENEEIYFTPAKYLNDPLEGYMDLSFKGDRILWTNFFKNYIFCLLTFRFMVTLAGNDDKFTKDDINTNFNYKLKEDLSMEGQPYRILCDEIFANPVVQKIIDYFSIREKPISKDELIMFLKGLHFYFLNTFVLVEMKKGMMKAPDEEIQKRYNESLGSLEFLGKAIDTLTQTDDTISVFKTISQFMNTMTDTFVYLRNLQNAENVIAENNFQLLLNFPKLYIDKLYDIMYPYPVLACFSEDYQDLSMWGYYANSSKGVCLIYKPKVKHNSFFLPIKKVTSWGVNKNGEYRESKSFVDMELKPVSYSKQRPLIPFFRSLGRLTLQQLKTHWYSNCNGEVSEIVHDLLDKLGEDKWRKNYWDNITNCINTKHTSWMHEKEYRVAIIPMFDDEYDTKEKRKLKYKFSSLAGLIFGVNADEQKKLEVIKILHEKCNKYGIKDFKLYQAIYNNESGEIEKIPINIFEHLISSNNLDKISNK